MAGATGVGAVDDRDLGIGQARVRIGGADPSIIPFPDLSQIDSRQNLSGETNLVPQLRQIENRHHRAEDDRNLNHSGVHPGKRLLRERHLRRAEVHLAGLDPPDTFAGADAFVGDVHLGVQFFEGLKPLLIERSRERGACSPERRGTAAGVFGSGRLPGVPTRAYVIEQPSSDLAGKIVLDAAPGKLAGSTQIRPESLTAFADHFDREISLEHRLVGAVRMRTEGDFTDRPDLASAFDYGVRSGRIRDNLNLRRALDAANQVAANVLRALAGSEGFDIDLADLRERCSFLCIRRRASEERGESDKARDNRMLRQTDASSPLAPTVSRAIRNVPPVTCSSLSEPCYSEVTGSLHRGFREEIKGCSNGLQRRQLQLGT
jgi:hypothetical protein